MDRKIRISLLLVACSCFFVSVYAETIALKSGNTVEGKIIEKTDKYVKIDFQGAPLTYFFDEIESIDGKKIAVLSSERDATKQIVEITETKVKNSQEYSSSDQKDIFEEKLNKFFDAAERLEKDRNNLNINESEIASNNLWKFTDDFPNSKFASDARRMNILIYFMGAINTQDKKSAQKWLKNMEGLANRYPNNAFQEFTIQEMRDKLDAAITADYFLSNLDMLTYMRAQMGFTFQDYEAAIQYSSLLKDKLNQIEDPLGTFQFEIYTFLSLSYYKLGKIGKEVDIAKEAINKFPNNIKLKQLMEKILERDAPH